MLVTRLWHWTPQSCSCMIHIKHTPCTYIVRMRFTGNLDVFFFTAVDCSRKPHCYNYCEHGFTKGADGCDTCTCAEQPGKDIKGSISQLRIVTTKLNEPDIGFSYNYIFVCVCYSSGLFTKTAMLQLLWTRFHERRRRMWYLRVRWTSCRLKYIEF